MYQRVSAGAADSSWYRQSRHEEIGMMMRRCVFCREELGVVLWVFDGVQNDPVPACGGCRDKLRLRVHKTEILDAALLEDPATQPAESRVQ
jgi:hypothetical protein